MEARMARKKPSKRSAKEAPVASPAPARLPIAAVPPLPSVIGAPRPLVVDERAVVTAGVAVVGLALWSTGGVLLPLLFVAVATFLGAPAVAALERRGVGRAVGAAVVVAGAGLLLTGLFALVVPALIKDLTKLAESVPTMLASLVDRVEATFHVQVPTTIKEVSGLASSELLEQLSGVAQSGGALVGKGALGLFRGAASALGVVGQALLVPILTYFVLAELPDLRRLLWALWPVRAQGAVAHYGPLMGEALSSLVRGQLIVAAIMAVIYAIGLAIAGVPLSLAIAVIAGAAYLIPFASAAVCVVFAIAFSVLELGSAALGPVVGAVLTAGVVQLAEGYKLTPRIVGEKAGLSPLATLLAVLCGGSAAGFLGVLFALPVGAVTAIIVRDVAEGRLRLAGVDAVKPHEVPA
jgi:predicted PurR-regulated permease PerM